MKVGIVPEHGKFEVREMSDPQVGRHDCLVKIDACAICTATDAHIISGEFPYLVDTPFVLGNESTGLIVEAGARVRSFRVGQRVTRPAAVLVGQRRDGLGSNWGGFAEMGLIHDFAAAVADGEDVDPAGGQSRVPLSPDVDPVSGALSVNQREILSVTRKQMLDDASRMVVIGSGYNGLLFSVFCKAFGAGRVLMIGNGQREQRARTAFDADAFLDYRRDPATAEVSDLLGGEATHVIDAVGSARSMAGAMGLLGPRTAFGRYGINDFKVAIPMTEEIGRSHPMLDMGTDELGATDQWYAMWKDGLFARDGMCDGTVPFDAMPDALGRLARREAVKLVVTM